MTLTFTNRPSFTTNGNVSSPKVTVTDIALDNSYPVAGEAVTAANLGLNRVDFAIATVKSAATTTVNVANAHYDKDSGKLLLYDETPAAVADNADVLGLVVQVIAWGR